MGLDRRVVVALSVIAVILAPAMVLRVFCAGHSCDEPEDDAVNVPFCSLPADQRKAIANGFREERSPDILTVTRSEPTGRVPLLFYGPGFEDVTLPDGVTLDQIAPTLAAAAGIERPHPEVRSGTPAVDVAPGSGARLILVIALKRIGSEDLDTGAWTELRELGNGVAASDQAEAGSLPLDPAAVLTTIGTGGLPHQHGITGAFVRNDEGELARAWSPRAPVSVIATLADDLDQLNDQDPRIGLVGTSSEDLGLIAGDWYIDVDRDDKRFASDVDEQIAEAKELLSGGYGADRIPDLLAVALEASPDYVTEAVRELLAAGQRATRGQMIAAVVGTGRGDNGPVNIGPLVERSIPGTRPLIEAVVPGGFFVNQNALAKTGTTEDEVIDAIKETGLFADAFAAITVSFARYC